MNKLTLTFSDSKLEHKYQQTQAALTRQGFGFKLSIPIISYLIQGSFWAIRGQVLLSVAYFVLSLLYSSIMYKITVRREWGNIMCYVLASFSFSASIMQFIPQWLHLTQNETLWIEDTAILMGTQISISSYPLLNAGMLALFVGTKIYLRPFSFLCVVFVLFTIQTWSYQYERIQTLRQQFLQKEKSVNQYNVFEDLIKDSLVILNYNQEWDRFTMAFANQQFFKEYSECAMEFLKELQFSQHKMSAMTYLHYKVNENKKNFTFEAFWKNRNQHIMIECWKYSILETQIILKFITKSSYSDNVYPLLYKGILKKLKKIDRQHYHTESLKNLLAALLVRPSSLVNVKIQSLNYRQLSALMMNLLRDNAAVFSLNLKSETFFTNVPLLYILMISLTKYYTVSSFSLSQLDDSLLEVHVKGKVKQINQTNKQFFHKLLDILVELLGIKSFLLEDFKFTCKIVNMESPFKLRIN